MLLPNLVSLLGKERRRTRFYLRPMFTPASTHFMQLCDMYVCCDGPQTMPVQMHWLTTIMLLGFSKLFRTCRSSPLNNPCFLPISAGKMERECFDECLQHHGVRSVPFSCRISGGEMGFCSAKLGEKLWKWDSGSLHLAMHKNDKNAKDARFRMVHHPVNTARE